MATTAATTLGSIRHPIRWETNAVQHTPEVPAALAGGDVLQAAAASQTLAAGRASAPTAGLVDDANVEAASAALQRLTDGTLCERDLDTAEETLERELALMAAGRRAPEQHQPPAMPPGLSRGPLTSPSDSLTHNTHFNTPAAATGAIRVRTESHFSAIRTNPSEDGVVTGVASGANGRPASELGSKRRDYAQQRLTPRGGVCHSSPAPLSHAHPQLPAQGRAQGYLAALKPCVQGASPEAIAHALAIAGTAESASQILGSLMGGMEQPEVHLHMSDLRAGWLTGGGCRGKVLSPEEQCQRHRSSSDCRRVGQRSSSCLLVVAN